jgi:hypothetical protein
MPSDGVGSPVALAGTLHDLFLMAAAVAAVALIATVFLREVSFARGAASADVESEVEVRAAA